VIPLLKLVTAVTVGALLGYTVHALRQTIAPDDPPAADWRQIFRNGERGESL
jgi:hypothetical protein